MSDTMIVNLIIIFCAISVYALGYVLYLSFKKKERCELIYIIEKVDSHYAMIFIHPDYTDYSDIYLTSTTYADAIREADTIIKSIDN